MQRWLREGRTSSEPRLEQVLPEESGRLDLAFQDAGSTVWLDFAGTAAATHCTRTVETNAKRDGAAARAEEGVKRSRYHSRATPFVVEADGRPGTSAKMFIRRYAQNANEGSSTSPAHAWTCLSSILQDGNADIEITAWTRKAIIENKVVFWLP